MSRIPPPDFLRPPAPHSTDAAPMHPAYPAVRGRRAAGFALVVASHLLLAWFLLAHAPVDRHAQAPARSGPEIQWLLPQAVPARTVAVAKPEPAAATLRQLPSRPPRQPVSIVAEPVSVPIAAEPEPVREPALAEAQPQEQQREIPSAPLDPARLVRDLKLAGMASGLDAKGKGGRTAAAMTLEAKLAAGIERAHAGDRGWLTSNGFEEISSTEGSGTRVYRMRSVFGTFCVYVTEGKTPVSGLCR